MKMTDIVYTDSYGTVSEAQRRAYKKHNVSPSDHNELVDHYGREAHAVMAEVAADPANRAPGSTSFSAWRWHQRLAQRA